MTLKNVPARDVYAMKFPGAPYGLKMACGENPKRVYGEKGRTPATRMGNVAGYRAAWLRAGKYRDDWEEYARKTDAGEKNLKHPDRDLELDTLAGVLAGEILVQNHCYRADEMVTMIEIAREFDYQISAFHHAVEAYKIADVLAQNGICADVWADWWGFKMEAFDGIRENAALVHAAGACAIMHSDGGGIQRLNQEAAKAMAAGNRIGLELREEDAIRWLTINPAKSIGVGDQTGSLEAGKSADVVVWSGDPFSVYSQAERVLHRRRAGVRPQRQGAPAGLRFLSRQCGDEPMKRALLTLALAAAGGVAGSLPAETIAITDGTIQTMGPAGAVEHGTVVIVDWKIAAVGAGVQIPPEARRIDARGRVVTPGLFNSLTRLGIVEVSAVEGSADSGVASDRITAAFDVADAINPRSTLIAVNRIEGLTRAVVAPTAGSSLIAGQGAVIHLGLASNSCWCAPAWRCSPFSASRAPSSPAGRAARRCCACAKCSRMRPTSPPTARRSTAGSVANMRCRDSTSRRSFPWSVASCRSSSPRIAPAISSSRFGWRRSSGSG